MMNEAVSSIMSTKLVAADPEDNLGVVKDLMIKHRVHHIPVVDGDQLSGLITTSDLQRLNRTHEQYPGILAKDIMTTKLATLEPTAKIGSAAELFLENLFHCIPIINDTSRKLLGIVTTHDVLKYSFKKEYPKHYHLVDKLQ